MSISVNNIYIWVNINLTDSNYLLNADHFAYAFETKKPNNLLIFSFLLSNKKEELI